jgi:hypothetical protein
MNYFLKIRKSLLRPSDDVPRADILLPHLPVHGARSSNGGGVAEKENCWTGRR